MEFVYDFVLQRPIISLSAALVASYVSVKLLKSATKLYFKEMEDLNKVPEHYEKGIIHLHMFPRSAFRQLANASPFAVKLESWLRLYKVPYKTVETLQMSSKTGQIPYIIFDGEELCDSNLIMDFLEKKFNIAPDEGLTEEQQAVSHLLLRTVDESLSWTYFTLRYQHANDFYDKQFRLPLPTFFKNQAHKDMKKKISKRMNLHGMGRKTISEIATWAQHDIQAVSKYLGQKKFLLGDKITKADCAVFAHFSQFAFVSMEYPHKAVLKECANLLPYLERVKKELWPDWDELVNMEVFS